MTVRRAGAIRRAAWIALALLALAAVANGVLAALQRRLLYFPVREDAEHAEVAARRAGLVPWRSPGGALLGWRSPVPDGRAAARAVVFHGNAGSALDRIYLRNVLQGPGVLPLDVRLAEYPGYGPRPGSPSEQALVAAAIEAIDVAAAEGPEPVLLAGESLGSAVAALAAAARRDRVAGLLLVTPLASVPAVAKRHFPFVPTALLVDRYDAGAALSRYSGPAAFLVAERDEVVFADLGRALFEGYSGPKRLWVEERAGHNTVTYDPADPRWAEMVKFLLAGR